MDFLRIWYKKCRFCDFFISLSQNCQIGWISIQHSWLLQRGKSQGLQRWINRFCWFSRQSDITYQMGRCQWLPWRAGMCLRPWYRELQLYRQEWRGSNPMYMVHCPSIWGWHSAGCRWRWQLVHDRQRREHRWLIDKFRHMSHRHIWKMKRELVR